MILKNVPMNRTLLFVAFSCGVALSSCVQRSEQVGRNDLLMFVYDFGSSAPDAARGGVVAAMWRDGRYVVSEDFPMHGNVHSGFVDPVIAKQFHEESASVISTCENEPLLPPGAHTFSLSVLNDDEIRELRVPYIAIQGGSHFPASDCIDAIRRITERMHASTAQFAPVNHETQVELERWFGVDGLAFR